jgi:hypothetical protein
VSRIRAFLLCVISAWALAGCGGGTSVAPLQNGHATATPSPSPAPTATPSATASPAQGGLFQNVKATSTGSPASPVPIPTLSSGTYTLAQLATFLDASATPSPGAMVGTVGIVTGSTASSLTLTQIPMIAQNDANGNPIPFVQNVAQVGSFGAPLTVDVNSTTVFSNGGLGGIPKGTMIAAGGSPDASGVLHAVVIVPLAYPGSAASARAHTQPAMVATNARHRFVDAFDTSVPGTFARRISIFPGLKGSAMIALLETTAPCNDLAGVGRPLGSIGTWSLSATPQYVLSPGELDLNFPYDVDYQSHPDLFTQTGTTFQGPGPAQDWINVAPGVPGGPGGYAAELTAGADIGISLTVGTTCPGTPTIQLAAATVGYAIDSATMTSLPGPKEQAKFSPVTCIGINSPLNINLFFSPQSGFPNLNPFGNFSAANLQFCDNPTVFGNYVTGNVGDITDAMINTTPVTFDPSQQDAANVYRFGTMKALDSPLTFSLTNLQYQPSYGDNYRLQYTLIGVPLISLGPSNVLPVTVPLTTQNVPVTLVATPVGFCASISGAGVFGPSLACNPANGGAASLNYVVCHNLPSDPDKCPTDSSASFTATLTDPGYTGEFEDSSLSTCSGTQTVDPITVSPSVASGPTATFTITAGLKQVPDGQGNDCDIYFEMPATPDPFYIDLHLLMPT